MDKHTTRDSRTGQYAFQNDWDRLCRCGHELGVHGEGGFDCFNADRDNIGAPYAGRFPATSCGCMKFRPTGWRVGVAVKAA
jgi:hypothetical protein